MLTFEVTSSGQSLFISTEQLIGFADGLDERCEKRKG